MCVSMSDKPFDAEACDICGQASATNGLSDMETHIENAPCDLPLKVTKQSNFWIDFAEMCRQIILMGVFYKELYLCLF
jgi:hypothetical protein